MRSIRPRSKCPKSGSPSLRMPCSRCTYSRQATLCNAPPQDQHSMDLEQPLSSDGRFRFYLNPASATKDLIRPYKHRRVGIPGSPHAVQTCPLCITERIYQNTVRVPELESGYCCYCRTEAFSLPEFWTHEPDHQSGVTNRQRLLHHSRLGRKKGSSPLGEYRRNFYTPAAP